MIHIKKKKCARVVSINVFCKSVILVGVQLHTSLLSMVEKNSKDTGAPTGMSSGIEFPSKNLKYVDHIIIITRITPYCEP